MMPKGSTMPDSRTVASKAVTLGSKTATLAVPVDAAAQTPDERLQRGPTVAAGREIRGSVDNPIVTVHGVECLYPPDPRILLIR